MRVASFFLVIVTLLNGCVLTRILETPRATAQRVALEGGFSSAVLRTPLFALQSFLKVTKGPADAVVYIEGDGAAWAGRASPPRDPSPRNPIGLRMAVKDPSPVVVYLGRPCQFLTRSELATCDVSYWTSARFSSDVMRTLHNALDQLKQNLSVERFQLVGYSGGGVLATALAGERDDVNAVTTLASPVDLDAWTNYHQVSPFKRSPIDLANQGGRIRSLKQIHFAGAGDTVVPTFIVQSYINKLGNENRATLIEIKSYDHVCCWADDWPNNYYREFRRAVFNNNVVN